MRPADVREPRTLAVALRIQAGSRPGFSLDVGFDVPPGITILFGPSGSGKSTILCAIAGLIRPDAGRITHGDQVWFDSDLGIDRAVHKRKVAFVFQSLALFPHLSALRNVEYGIDRSLSRRMRCDRALAMLERMKVAHVAHRRPATFSGGEAQRVALARAFAMSPEIVLLDEALSALDRDLRRNLAEDVQRTIVETRIPLIWVTHHRNEARAVGDRAVLIEGGRITAVGAIDEVLPSLGASPDDRQPLSSSREQRLEEIDGTPLPRIGRA